tara:strand:+ start:331 stop:666 length:336 start_codon:yes stop_codon:yes gene_type:complete
VRVKISYGVEIDEVPKEIKGLLEYVYTQKNSVDMQLNLVERLIDEKDLEAAVATIDKLRLSLAKMDNRMSDISQITNGYINYVEQEGVQNVSDGRPSVDTTGSDSIGESSE